MDTHDRPERPPQRRIGDHPTSPDGAIGDVAITGGAAGRRDVKPAARTRGADAARPGGSGLAHPVRDCGDHATRR
jgi:hypothetical protein